MTKIDVWFGIVALLSLARPAIALQRVRVPKGNHVVMIDGKLSIGEWDDAAQFSLSHMIRIYIKHSRGYVWMAAERRNWTISRWISMCNPPMARSTTCTRPRRSASANLKAAPGPESGRGGTTTAGSPTGRESVHFDSGNSSRRGFASTRSRANALREIRGV
jgi:hypothetical protein